MKTLEERVKELDWHINYHSSKLDECKQEQELLNQMIEFKDGKTRLKNKVV